MNILDTASITLQYAAVTYRKIHAIRKTINIKLMKQRKIQCNKDSLRKFYRCNLNKKLQEFKICNCVKKKPQGQLFQNIS